VPGPELQEIWAGTSEPQRDIPQADAGRWMSAAHRALSAVSRIGIARRSIWSRSSLRLQSLHRLQCRRI